MRAFKIASILFIIAITLYLLIEAKDLLIPLVVATAIFYLIITLSDFFRRIRIAGWRPPNWLTLIASAITILGVLFGCVMIMVGTIERLIRQVPQYQSNLESMINPIIQRLPGEQSLTLTAIIQDINTRTLALDLGQGLSVFLESLVLVTIYIIFLLLEQPLFSRKLGAFFPDPNGFDRAKSVLAHINESIQTYLILRTLTSLLKGFLSYIILLLLHVDFAIFWAFLIFILNYIPSIGPITATVTAALFTLVQFQDWSVFLIALLSIMGMELAVGHYVEPRLVGRSLNISPLVVLISLTLWGSIWGIIGMFLCVPIMATIIIILAEFPESRPFAIMLSEKGKIDLIKERSAE